MFRTSQGTGALRYIPVRTAQWLMFLQTMPRVNRDPVIPPHSELWNPAILGLKLNRRNLLKRVFLRVPFNANVIDRLLLQILQHLSAE